MAKLLRREGLGLSAIKRDTLLEEIEPVILEIPDPQGPLGIRGMAEMPFIPLAPALTHAIHDATGVWFTEFPLTPDRVVAELRKHGVG